MNGDLPAIEAPAPSSLQRLTRVVAPDRVGDAQVGLRLRSRRHRLPHIVSGDRRLAQRVQRYALEAGAQPHDIEPGALHQRARRRPAPDVTFSRAARALTHRSRVRVVSIVPQSTTCAVFEQQLDHPPPLVEGPQTKTTVACAAAP